MRILITGSKEYPMGTSDDPMPSGGMEVYTQNIARALVGIGHTPIVLTRRFKNTKPHEKINGVEVERVPWLRGFFFRNISFNTLAFFRELSLDYDAVLANGVFASFFAWLANIIKRKPVVSRCAGIAWVQSQYPKPVQWVLHVIEHLTYGGVDTVIFLSKPEVEAFKRKMGFLPKKYVIIPTGVDFKKVNSGNGAKVRKEFHLGKDKVILFVGRLIAVKRLPALIKGFQEAKLKGYKLVIVGDGPERDALKKLAAPSGDNIVFTGMRLDTENFYDAADLFALVSESEGLPLSLLEAYAAGLPCILTDIGLPADGTNALIVKPGDHKAIAKALKKLFSDAALRKRMSKANQKKARTEFTWENAVDLYMKTFQELKA